MTTSQHIGKEQFERLLDDKSDTSISPQVAQHLEECSHCRERLEHAAADPSWWSCLADLSNVDLHSTLASPAIDGPLDGTDEPRSRTPGSRSRLDHAELLDAASHPEMLGQLNQFEIERVIGQGGMGVVFKGFDRELHRTVAIKLMSPHLAHNATARKRFEREARAAAAVVHPNVIPIHGVSLFKGQPLIVMPLIAGSSLQAQVEQQGPLETKDVVRIGMQIAAGLSAAHDQGLIHRDIKPANILLEQDVSRVVITDFGLARAADELAMTQTGWLAGTPHYMSPEQARGVAIDARSDLFSLGAVLYFIATGQEPFRAEKPIAVLHKICHDPAIPAKQINSDIPQTLSDIIERLLEKNPQDRFASATRTQKLLEEYLAELQQPNRTQRPMRIITRRQVRQRWRMAQVAALFAVVIPVACWAGWYGAKYLNSPPAKVQRSLTMPDEQLPLGADPANRSDLVSPNGFSEQQRQLDVFGEQLRQLEREIQSFEQKLNWELPQPAPQNGSPDVTPPDESRYFRQIESVQTLAPCASSNDSVIADSINQKQMGRIHFEQLFKTAQSERPSRPDSVVQWLWQWVVDRWSESISAASFFINN